jgi:hypothetical protein
MTRTDFAACMAVLEAGYPRTGKLNQQQLDVWFDNLSDLTVEQLRNAVTVAIRQGDDWPTISKLRKYSGADGIPAKDRPLVAWYAVINALAKLEAHHSPCFDDPVVNAVLRQLGGWPELTNTPANEMNWLQKDFCAAYIALSGVALRDEQISRLPGVPGMSRREKDRQGNTITLQEVVDVHCLTGPCTANEAITKRIELLPPPKTETTEQSLVAERDVLANKLSLTVHRLDSTDTMSTEQREDLATRIEQLTEKIAELDRQIEESAERRYDWLDRLIEQSTAGRDDMLDSTGDDPAGRIRADQRNP